MLVDLVNTFMNSQTTAAAWVMFPSGRRAGKPSKPAVTPKHARAAKFPVLDCSMHLHIWRHESERMRDHQAYLCGLSFLNDYGRFVG
jgi:hypothetical protein